jgi:hypothetical protein
LLKDLGPHRLLSCRSQLGAVQLLKGLGPHRLLSCRMQLGAAQLLKYLGPSWVATELGVMSSIL